MMIKPRRWKQAVDVKPQGSITLGFGRVEGHGPGERKATLPLKRSVAELVLPAPIIHESMLELFEQDLMVDLLIEEQVDSDASSVGIGTERFPEQGQQLGSQGERGHVDHGLLLIDLDLGAHRTSFQRDWETTRGPKGLSLRRTPIRRNGLLPPVLSNEVRDYEVPEGYRSECFLSASEKRIRPGGGGSFTLYAVGLSHRIGLFSQERSD